MSNGIHVGSVNDIEEGEAEMVSAEVTGIGRDIAVFHAEDGNFYALDDECTHETASLSEGWVEGTEVECPVHSARFCLKSGEALCMPATINARTHRIEVIDDEIYLHPDTSGTAA